MKRAASDLLERCLRAEAQDLRAKDGFSPLLHQRIMASLRQQGLAGTPVRAERTWPLWRIAGWTAAAAALILVTIIILRSAPTERPHPPIAYPNPAKNEQIVQKPVNFNTALEERKFAYLDRDASNLISFVARQVPTFPTARNSNPPAKNPK